MRSERRKLKIKCLSCVFAAAVILNGNTAAFAEQMTETADTEKALQTAEKAGSSVYKVLDASEGSGIFEDLILADADQIFISVSSSDENVQDGLVWDLHMENRGEEELAVSLADTGINGWMCATDPWGLSGWSLKPGEKVDYSIEWLPEDLSEAGIEELSTVALELKAYTRGEDGNHYLVSDYELIDFTGDGEKQLRSFETGRATEPEAKDQLIGTQVYAFDVLSYDEGEEGEVPVWHVYMENRSDKMIQYKISDALINGYTTDPYWSKDVLPFHRAASLVEWWNLTLDPAEFEDIQEASFTLTVWKEKNDGYVSFADPESFDVRVYPSGEENKPDENAQLIPAETDIILSLDDKGEVFIVDHGYSSDKSYYALDFAIRNAAGDPLTYICDSLLADGKEVYPAWQRIIPAGAASTASLLLSSDVLARMGIDSLQELELTLNICDENGKVLESTVCKMDAATGKYTIANSLPVSEPEEETEELFEETTEYYVNEEYVTTEAPEAQTQAAESETEAVEEETQTAESETEAAEEETQTAESETQTADIETEFSEDETQDTGEETAAQPNGKTFSNYLTVLNVQIALRDAGFDIGTTDGEIGSVTREAIQAYREEHGLPEGDSVDDVLLFAMGMSDSNTLEKVQIALNDLGYDCGKADGVFGENTRAQINAYRQDHGLEGEGLDQQMLDALKITRE